MFSSPPIYSKPNAPKQPRRAAYAVPEVCGPTKGKFCNIAGSPVNTRSGMLRKSVAKMKRKQAALCAKISETPSLPGFSVEGGQGNAHEEVRKRCFTPFCRFGLAGCGAEGGRAKRRRT